MCPLQAHKSLKRETIFERSQCSSHSTLVPPASAIPRLFKVAHKQFYNEIILFDSLGRLKLQNGIYHLRSQFFNLCTMQYQKYTSIFAQYCQIVNKQSHAELRVSLQLTSPPIYLNWIFPILQFEILSLMNQIFSQFETNWIFFSSSN